jgi:hypothetical protein
MNVAPAATSHAAAAAAAAAAVMKQTSFIHSCAQITAMFGDELGTGLYGTTPRGAKRTIATR